jgi:hypothetical protein
VPMSLKSHRNVKATVEPAIRVYELKLNTSPQAARYIFVPKIYSVASHGEFNPRLRFEISRWLHVVVSNTR